MDKQNPYFRQVELLVRILPVVGSQECFALKGGTAINLFYRDMPRLSVDIDLVYVPIKDRATSLNEISEGLSKLASLIQRLIPEVKIQYSHMGKTDIIIKLLVQIEQCIVKIELSPVLRGTVHKPALKRIGFVAEETFGFVEVPLVSFEDLFAGKIIAALDRQHPRDLFDVKLLFENEGITPSLKEAFLVYLISHNRSFLEILNPSLLDIRQSFETDFKGMTSDSIDLDELNQTRVKLIDSINRMLTEKDKLFLLRFKEGNPDWDHIGFPHIKDLPAVKWKLHNLDLMRHVDRESMIDNLRVFFRM